MAETSIPEIPLKRCSKCKQLFPATKQHFFAHKFQADGLRPECKVCHFKRKKRVVEVVPQGCKRCTRCQHIQPLEEFGNFSQAKDGKRNFCKDCGAKADGKKRRIPFTKLAPEGFRCCAKCEEIKPNTLDFFTLGWRDKPSSICRECKSRYDKKRAKQLGFKRNAYAGSNPSRRQRIDELPNTLTLEQWEGALNYFGNRCAVCGNTAGLWVSIVKDHWMPVSRGGATIVENIIPLCHGLQGIPDGQSCCNNDKSAKLPEQWLIRRFGKRKANVILKRIGAYFTWVLEHDNGERNAL